MVPTTYYLILSAILFTIGVVGVLIRRNVLIIFMSVEMMLNAVNLTFVALSQPVPEPERPDLRADGDGRRRGRGRRRAGDRDDRRSAQGYDEYRGCESVEGLIRELSMLDYAWLMLLFPALGTLIIALFGTRLGKRAVSSLAPAMVFLSFAVAWLLRHHARPARGRAQPRGHALAVDGRRRLSGRHRPAARPALGHHGAGRHRHRLPDSRLLRRLHARRRPRARASSPTSTSSSS